jgi:prophage antirepressor-like protein
MGDLVPLRKVFEYEGQRVRTVMVDGQPRFAAKDVGKILGFNNISLAVHGNPTRNDPGLDEDEKGIYIVNTPGGPQPMLFVTEAGLYKLIMKSRRPEAKAFQRWITHEVLPALRTTGHYEVPNFNGRRLPQNYMEALEELISTEKQRMALAGRVDKLAPKGDMFDLFLTGENAQDMNSVAKSLGIGRNKLFAFLREKRILDAQNRPYQQFLEADYFVVREVPLTHLSVNKTQTLVTAKGVEFIARKLKEWHITLRKMGYRIDSEWLEGGGNVLASKEG